MKRRSKEINIFGMSALDLFASALGAFILIAVVLFPYFPNIDSSPENIAALQELLQDTQQQLQTCRENLAQTQEELAQTQEELQASQGALQGVQEELQQCTEDLRKKFLLVLISWGSQDDVDLHVIDPQGNEFYYKKTRYPGTQAKLEEDNIHGPGNEIWLHPQATPGEYRIYYKLFSQRSSNVLVRGAMLTPNGRESIPTLRLTRTGQKPLVAIVTVNNNGNASLRVQ